MGKLPPCPGEVLESVGRVPLPDTPAAVYNAAGADSQWWSVVDGEQHDRQAMNRNDESLLMRDETISSGDIHYNSYSKTAGGAHDSVPAANSLVQAIHRTVAAPAPAGSAFPFVVSEANAIQRIRYYLGQPDGVHAAHGVCVTEDQQDNHQQDSPVSRSAPITGYKDARMQAYGVDNSTKLSPFLALGVISPRTIAAAVQDARRQGIIPSQGNPGDTFEWLLMHLVIRDFYIYTALKHGDALFEVGGVQGVKGGGWKREEGVMRAWIRGETGVSVGGGWGGVRG